MTGGLSSLVYAITQAGQDGWLAAETLGVFARVRGAAGRASSAGSCATPSR